MYPSTTSRDGHPMGVITIKFVFEVHNKRFIVSVRRTLGFIFLLFLTTIHSARNSQSFTSGSSHSQFSIRCHGRYVEFSCLPTVANTKEGSNERQMTLFVRLGRAMSSDRFTDSSALLIARIPFIYYTSPSF
ncbi:uncharacterized protein LOC134180396 isoform X3 [Corticium candelabrum]|uniref:uncharacterized protein LOC134180396 isoform X3 n=1 Tax=Corticium candelabrum TaxID=121492 RepID=UPI002E272C6D|nr:uncharacterized protein LOC134180396 isoform X3 [Corticium candelabrum]